MPYIGRDNSNLSNVEVLDNITFDGSSSYTLQKGGVNFTPSSANNILISIDGVVQAGNFTVSSSTIDFGTAVAGTSTCDFILHYGIGLITTPADGTVTTAKLGDSAVTTAKLNDASVSLAKLTATGTKDATTFLRGDNSFAVPPLGGITMADQWRLTTSFTDPDNAFITSNLERVDDTGYSVLGTGMTESSGEFSFPSTGYYLISATFSVNVTSVDQDLTLYIRTTTDNSTYISRNIIRTGGTDSSRASVSTSSIIFDVTDISNCKVKFYAESIGAGTVMGSSTMNETHFTFIRLGDT